MKGVFGYRSKKGIVLLGIDNKQVLFSKDDKIYGIQTEQISHVNSLDFGNYNGIDALVASTDGTLKRVRKNVLISTDFEFLGSKNSTYILNQNIKSNLKHCKNIEDMLLFLYSNFAKGQKNIQFGFVDKYDAKTLLSPGIDFLETPDEYLKSGKPDAQRFSTNKGFYDVLLSSLEYASSVLEKRQADAFKKTFFSRKTDKKLRDAKHELKDTILRYMDYHNGPLERFTIKNFLQNKKDTVKPTAYVPKKRWSLQEELDNELLPRGQKSVLITFKNNNYSKKVHESIYSLSNEIGLAVRPFLNLPLISIKGDMKDVKKFYDTISDKKYNKFGKQSKTLLRDAKKFAYSHGVYIPELIDAFKKGEKITPKKIAPHSYKKKTLDELWNLKNIAAGKANQITTGDGAKVGVVDTGTDYTHPELSDRFTSTKGYDFVRNNPDPIDRHYHGTHVAGTVAGDLTGVAPGCTLYALRVLNSNGSGSLDDVMLGVDWCVTNGLDIANLSLGSPTFSFIEEEFYKEVYKRGLTVIAAAGNSGYGANYPAAHDTVISVAAVDRFNEHAEFSNIYSTNVISSPGVGILSTLPNNDKGVLSGTSMASPHIAGGAALFYSAHGKIGQDKFRDSLKDKSKELGNPDDPDNRAKFGFGLIQCDRLVD